MVLDGVLEHGDNAGNAGALLPGDVQWMTAGRGIIHRELAFRNEHAHTLQLWVNLPARRKMVETGYQDLRASSRPMATTPGVAGRRRLRHGRRVSPARRATSTRSRERSSRWSPVASVDYAIPAAHRAFLYVLEGDVHHREAPGARGTGRMVGSGAGGGTSSLHVSAARQRPASAGAGLQRHAAAGARRDGRPVRHELARRDRAGLPGLPLRQVRPGAAPGAAQAHLTRGRARRHLGRFAPCRRHYWHAQSQHHAICRRSHRARRQPDRHDRDVRDPRLPARTSSPSCR